MGRVFTPEEVRCRRVPTIEEISFAAQQLRAWLPTKEWLVGAILCGSVLAGRHNRRSDVDLCIVHRFNGRWSPNDIDGALRREALRGVSRYVLVNWFAIDEVEIRAGQHTIGWGFLRHLQSSKEAGGLIGADPFEGIVLPPRYSPAEDTASYVEHKLRVIRARRSKPFTSDEDLVTLLEDALCAPWHAARRHLDFIGRNCADVVRPNVLALAEQESMAPELLRQLGSLDAAYTASLSRHLGRFVERDYRAELTKLEAAVPMAVDFLRHLLKRMRERRAP